jgi:single-stranded DNA-specific DHH superfamily exonuclease
MKRNLNDLFELGKSFIKNIKKSEKVFVLYHKDADGVCSAAICNFALKKLGIKISRIESAQVDEREKIFDKLKDCDVAILLDLAGGYFKDKLNAMDKKFLVIDHHMINKNLKGEKIVYINPRFENEEAYKPASYVVYKFFDSFMDLKGLGWIAVLGTIGDYGFGDCRDLIDKFVGAKTRYEAFETEFGKAALFLSGAAAEIGYEKVFEELIAAKNIEELRKNKKLVAAYANYEKEYEAAEEEFWKNAEKFEKADLIFSVVHTKRRGIGSALSTALGAKYQDKIIAVAEKIGDNFKVHTRYQTAGKHDVHMGEVSESCGRKSGGLGGGHREAAGSTIPVKNLEAFKKRLVDKLEAKFKK